MQRFKVKSRTARYIIVGVTMIAMWLFYSIVPLHGNIKWQGSLVIITDIQRLHVFYFLTLMGRNWTLSPRRSKCTATLNSNFAILKTKIALN